MARVYPDVETALVQMLSTFAPNRVGTETPKTLNTALPFVRVLRRGGRSDDVVDFARVDVEVFAGTRSTGYPLIEQIRQYLISTAPYRVYANLDRIVCDSGPQELPRWSDTIRRWTTTYSIQTRRIDS